MADRRAISITFELPQVDNLLTIDPRMRIVISDRRLKILARIHLGKMLLSQSVSCIACEKGVVFKINFAPCYFHDDLILMRLNFKFQ